MLPFLDVPRSLDRDARAFINLTGATDRQAINAWVRGVKALGLWNNMVCWPLRSSQNYGTGSTVASLGGLGSFPGTMVNGPTWGSLGMGFGVSGRLISVASIASRSFGAVANFILISGAGIGIQTDRLDVAQVGGSVKQASDTGVASIVSVASAVSSDIFHLHSSCSALSGSVTARLFFNGVFQATGTRSITSTNQNQTTLGNTKGGTLPITSEAFAWVSTSELSDFESGALHTLYKTTLGVGLGLP